MDNEMINPWTQVKSYHGHFEKSQTSTTRGLFIPKENDILEQVKEDLRNLSIPVIHK